MSTTTAVAPTVRRAAASERATLTATLTAGFMEDPVVGWMLPDPNRRRELLEPLLGLYVDAYLPHGETYVADGGNGVAVWLPPTARLFTPEQELAFAQAVKDIAGPDADRTFQLEETFARYHPSEPHYYLQLLSTVPAFQGRGIGSALLGQMLERADREGMPAYHEATTPRNRALYERHGYVSQGEFRLPDGGPPLWRMWREPR